MTLRRSLTAIGAGLTTAALVGVSVTELLGGSIEFSAIVGLPIGILVGVAVFGGILVGIDRFDTPIGQVLGAYAAFGYAVLGCMLLRYANVAGARRVLGLPVIVGVATAVAGVALAGLWLTDRNRTA